MGGIFHRSGRFFFVGLGAFLLLHCSSSTSGNLLSDDSPSASTDGKGDSTKSGGSADGTTKGADPNAPAGVVQKPRIAPVLSFAFDGDGDLSLRARIQADKLPQGGSVALKLIAAKNGSDFSQVDCSTLASTGTQVSLANAKTDGKYALADVNVDMNQFSNRLDGFKRTVIQACLFDSGGKVVAQTSTNLMAAWDVISGAQTPPVFHGIEAYADSCEDEIGENPMFGDGTQTFDCTTDPRMHVVPITATASDGTVTRLDETTTHWPLTSTELAATTQCDRPAWLGYQSATQCAPFTRIGNLVNSKGTNFVVICRREAAKPLSDPSFDIIASIAHNPTTGKTCFFNNHMDGTSSDGTKVPPTHTPTSDQFWMDYGAVQDQACPTCHDSDPYIHSPWMDSAIDPTSKHAIVPKIGENPAYTHDVKYSLHAAESFMSSAKGQADWAQPQALTNAGSCDGCHRIGSKGSAQFLSAMSEGDQTQLQSFGVWDSLTPAFKTTANLHWMPADTNALRTINSCGQNANNCQSTEVPH
jgi:hypothetical protein